MTKSASRLRAPQNVRVNSEHPGANDTDMLQDRGSQADGRLVSQIPLGRPAEADESRSERIDGTLYLNSVTIETTFKIPQ